MTDLAGNVRKWLRDRFDLDFFHRLQDGERDPVNEDPQRPNFRMHGGTWRGDRNFARAADWTEGYPWEQYIDGGFRPAWPVDIT